MRSGSKRKCDLIRLKLFEVRFDVICGPVIDPKTLARCLDLFQKIHPFNGSGLSGSGLLDAIAACLELEIIDETGAMDEALLLCENVVLQPRDVRAVQLAKAAVAAGIETICAEAGICVDAVQTFYIAGGFGSHLNIASAVKIGLIPRVLSKRAKVLGNAALAGAVEMLLDQNLRREAKEIAGKSRHINLGGNKVFNELYIENMLFE